MVLQIVSNVPGLQDTGVVWPGEFAAFLLGFWFTQSIVDRRLFYFHDKSGPLLMMGTFVVDCKLVVQSGTIAAAFHKAWEKRHRGPPDVDATARDFPGLKYVRGGEGEVGTVATGCCKALVDLEGCSCGDLDGEASLVVARPITCR